MTATQRYWDGSKWTDNVAPLSGTSGSNGPSSLVIGLILAAGVVGFVMSMQSASLLTGTGGNWTGVALIVGAGVLGWVLKAPVSARVLIGVGTAIAILVMSLESQLSDKREEITNLVEP